jgi:hypothetical protein
MKNVVFWDDTQSGPSKNRRFGRKSHLQHQADKNY